MAGKDSPEISTDTSIAKRERGRHGLGSIREHRANWWLDLRHAGTRHRIKLGATKLLEKREARQIADAKIKELLMPKAPEPLKSKAFQAFALEDFAPWATKERLSWGRYHGKKLLNDTHPSIRQSAEFFADKSLREVTGEDVKDFASHIARLRIKGRAVKNRTVNGYIRDLRWLFNAAIKWGYAETNPTKGYKYANEDRQKGVTRIFETDEEQNKLLDALPAWLRLMTGFGLQTAARRGDLLKLTWGQINAKSNSVEFLETKEGRPRHVNLSSRALEILALLRAPGVKPDAFVFEPDVPRETLKSRIRREWKRAIAESGIEKIRFHDTRHTVGTRLVRSGTDLETVRQIMGHASLKTTQRYLHTNDKLKQQAVDKLSEFGHRLPTTTNDGVAETPVSGSKIN